MFQRLSNSWELLKASATVLAQDKELMIFPIVSGILSFIVTVTFAVPMFLTGMLEYFFSEAPGANLIGGVVLLLFYMVNYFVIIFSNSALVGAAMIRLQGGDPTVGDGFRAAWGHVGSIFGYAAIAATVGFILRMISERNSRLGRIVVSLVGMMWNVATYLVVPVLVMEGVGPIEAIKRSVELLKRTWGEQIVGNIGMGAIFTLINLGILIITIPIIVVCVINELFWLAIGLGVMLFIVLTILGLVNGALTGIYTAAVYRYAVDGSTGSVFRSELIENAFFQK